MIIPIYPERCWIESEHWGRILEWTQYRLVRRKDAYQATDRGFGKGRVSGGNTIRVSAPLAKVSEDGRKVILSDGLAFDPQTVLLMARAGRRSMRVMEE